MMVIDASIVKRHIKSKADSTLLNMKKAELIEYIRTLEHNYNVAVSFNEQQARNIETMMKNGDIPHHWISVEDRLPDEQHDWVLVSIEFVPEGECAVPHVAELRDGVWHAYCDDIPLEEAFLKVTHWMPLPEAPEGELYRPKKGGANVND